ncbi:hypothetical protein [Streptomyces sp. x-80]
MTTTPPDTPDSARPVRADGADGIGDTQYDLHRTASACTNLLVLPVRGI